MNNEVDIYEKADDYSSGEIVQGGKRKLSIFVTDVDKYGKDVTKMSNFFELYIHQLTDELRLKNAGITLGNTLIVDVVTVNEVVHLTDAMTNGEYELVPDFDSLPKDTIGKVVKGIHKIGASKQVRGNMRAVIISENNVREKDITLKRVKTGPDKMEAFRNIAIQAQLKQIYNKLNEIQELQSYQIDRSRDRDIVTPFLYARDNILRAQIGGTREDEKEILIKAGDELTKALNAIYTDMATVSKHLTNLTRFPILRLDILIYRYIKFLILDLQLATTYVGVQMHIFDYLGDKVSSNLALDSYQYFLKDFFTKSINEKGQSAALLIHLHYPYNEKNRNYWFKLITDMKYVLESDLKSIDGKELFLACKEDVSDGN